jgi:cell fate regulator YaaT (PSP1 superfamily)
VNIATVRFNISRKKINFSACGTDLRIGDRCIVTTDRGVELGTVTAINTVEKLPEENLRKVLRKATERDLFVNERNKNREFRAAALCKRRIEARKLPMKLSRVEYLFDGSRVIFYFTADHRVDFRELVKDLARELRTRIEMRQIGARDEARLIGSMGCCSRHENCSRLFLSEMESVSVRTVKSQGLGMNLSRLTGMCGRLKCCLNFVSDKDTPENLDCPHRKNKNTPGIEPQQTVEKAIPENDINSELSSLS